MEIIPGGQTLGARIQGIDLGSLCRAAIFDRCCGLWGNTGCCVSLGRRSIRRLSRRSRRFGDLEVNVTNQFHEPDFPEIMVLSNQMGPDGKPAGANDTGQGWHTNMSHSADIALANVLHAQAVPTRNGKSLGETQFRNMHAAYDELPGGMKERREGWTATHDFEKFWEMMRHRPGSRRAALTEAQKRKKPPVSQPLVRVHPLTERQVLYANPGYTMWIDGMDRLEGDKILDYLVRHQERVNFLYAHQWRWRRADVGIHRYTRHTDIRPADLPLVGSPGGNDGHQTKRPDSRRLHHSRRPRQSAAG
jgi:taurine dioxygenase